MKRGSPWAVAIGAMWLAASGHVGIRDSFFEGTAGPYRVSVRVVPPDVVLAALDHNKKFLRGEVARRVNLKFAPDIRFRVDERFDEAERIEKLLRTPAVQKDLKQDSDEN